MFRQRTATIGTLVAAAAVVVAVVSSFFALRAPWNSEAPGPRVGRMDDVRAVLSSLDDEPRSVGVGDELAPGDVMDVAGAGSLELFVQATDGDDEGLSSHRIRVRGDSRIGAIQILRTSQA